MEDPDYFTSIVSAAVLLAPSKDLIDTMDFWKLSVKVEKMYNEMLLRRYANKMLDIDIRRELKKFHRSRLGHLEIHWLP